jgi:hypothetical protein
LGIYRRREEVVHHVCASLLNGRGRTYGELYRAVSQKMAPVISHRDFSAQLTNLKKDGLLRKDEDTTSNYKLKPSRYSLTEKARSQHRFNILGAAPEKEKLKHLYRLIFFFGAISLPNGLADAKLSRFLRLAHATKKELVELKRRTTDYGMVQIDFRPINGIVIYRNEFHDVKRSWQSCYMFKLPGVSIKEILRTKQSWLEADKFTHDEVFRAFAMLEGEALIRKVLVFDGEIRYEIADPQLQKAISDIWTLFQLTWMTKIMLWKLRKPTADERAWLERIKGKKGASATFNFAHGERQKSRSEDPRFSESMMRYGQKEEVDLQNRMTIIKVKHSQTIKSYPFLEDIIASIFKEIII